MNCVLSRHNISFLLSIFLAGAFISCDFEDLPSEHEIKDARDGRIYKIIQVGDKIWMAENLAYLPQVDTTSEESNTKPYYYIYGYDEPKLSIALQTTNYMTFGVLYNWAAAMEACPEGWHLPSDYEWKDLELYFGMDQAEVFDIGYRETGEVGRQIKSPYNWEGTGYGIDLPGFNAKPGGRRSAFSGYFIGLGTQAVFWTSTLDPIQNAYLRFVELDSVGISRSSGSRKNGISVRCVRD